MHSSEAGRLLLMYLDYDTAPVSSRKKCVEKLWKPLKSLYLAKDGQAKIGAHLDECPYVAKCRQL